MKMLALKTMIRQDQVEATLWNAMLIKVRVVLVAKSQNHVRILFNQS